MAGVFLPETAIRELCPQGEHVLPGADVRLPPTLAASRPAAGSIAHLHVPVLLCHV